MISWKRLRAPCFAGTFVLLTLGAGAASADIGLPFQSTLTKGNTSSIGTGPFGTVTVTLTSATTATLVFNSGSGYLFTDGGSVGANGNFTLTSFSGDCSSCTYSQGSGNEDGFGQFTAEIDSGNSGPGGRSSTITENVTATGSTTWTNASQVLTDNGSGYDAAAHVFVTSGTGTGNTGFAAELAGSGTSVPEPTAIILLGSSMIGLGAIVRRRRSGRVV